MRWWTFGQTSILQAPRNCAVQNNQLRQQFIIENILYITSWEPEFRLLPVLRIFLAQYLVHSDVHHLYV